MARSSCFLSAVLLPLYALVFGLAARAFGADPGAGTYFSVIHGTTYDQTGYVRVVIGKSGAGSVSVKLGDQSTCVVGVGPGGPIGGPISYHPINPNPVMQVTLSLRTLPQGGTALSGTIIDDWGDILNVTLPNAKPAVNSNTLAGRYTLLFETPSAGSAFTNDIAGFGTLRVFKTGHLIFHGTLSDGSSVFQLGTLNSSGNWELLAKSQGRTLSGEVDFADETQTDCTGDLELSGPGKNGGPETDVSMQLVGSYYDPTLWWNPNVGWDIAASNDGGSTISFDSTMSATGDLLYGGSSTPKVLSMITNFATVDLEQETGSVVGAYGGGLDEFHGLIGVLYQKTSSAFGLTTSLGSLPSAGQLRSVGANLPIGNSVKSRISDILRILKPRPTGIFSVETFSAVTGLGGLVRSGKQSNSGSGSSDSSIAYGGSLNGNLNLQKTGSGQLSGAGSLDLGSSFGGGDDASITISGGTLSLGSSGSLSLELGSSTGSNPFFIIGQ